MIRDFDAPRSLAHAEESLRKKGYRKRGSIGFRVSSPAAPSDYKVIERQLCLGRVDISVFPNEPVELEDLADFAKKLLPARYQIGFEHGGYEPSYSNMQGFRLPQFRSTEDIPRSGVALPLEEHFSKALRDFNIRVFPDRGFLDLLDLTQEYLTGNNRHDNGLYLLGPLTWGVIHQTVADIWRSTRRDGLQGGLARYYFPESLLQGKAS